MAFSRLIVQLIRNRALNPVWLRALTIIACRASIDPDYAHRVGCVVTGLAPAIRTLGLSVPAKTARQALTSRQADTSRHRPGRRSHRGHPAPDLSRSTIGGTTRHALTPRELADWAAGVGRAMSELTTQLTRAKLTQEPITKIAR
jgi:hypothetical protein